MMLAVLFAQADGAAGTATRWSDRLLEMARPAEVWLAEPHGKLLLAAGLLAVSLYIFMPGAPRPVLRIVGSLLGGMGVVLLLLLAEPIGFSLKALAFTIVTVLTLVAAVGTVSSRSPIYSAVWFAATLFGVSLLLLINGAQFLGIATVAVYAGAIVVTLLFVLMLAQPRGHTRYDRISWGHTAQWLACIAGAASSCLLVWAFLATPVSSATADAAANPVLTSDHVASLGSVLFSRYLIAVEIAGVLLFTALVGAVSIAATQHLSIDRQFDDRRSGTHPESPYATVTGATGPRHLAPYRGGTRHE